MQLKNYSLSFKKIEKKSLANDLSKMQEKISKTTLEEPFSKALEKGNLKDIKESLNSSNNLSDQEKQNVSNTFQIWQIQYQMRR